MGLFTKLLLHGDGADASTTILDSEAGTKKTVTAVGNAQIDTAQKQFGTGSILFDGTGDYLSLADSNDWNLGSDDFTVDAWARFAAFPSNNDATIVAQYGSTDNIRSWSCKLADTSGVKTLRMTVSANGTATSEFDSTTITVSLNTWYHFAFVRDSNTLRFFVDGTAYGTGDLTGITFYDTTELLTIGCLNSPSPALFINGWIDEFRISKGIARWTSNFTPPIVAYASEELTLTETITASEAFKKITGRTKRFTDSVATSDAYSDLASLVRRLLDSMVLTDKVSKGLAKTLLDSMTITDLIKLISGKGRSYLDNITLTDILKKDISKRLLDSVTLTDKVKKDISKRLLDSVTITDLIKLIRGYSRNFTDTITLTDILSKLVAYRKIFSDTITLTELFNKIIQRTKTFSDAITLTDIFTKRSSISFNFRDTITMVDRDFVLSGGEQTIVDISKNPQISAGEEQGDLLTIHNISDAPKLRISDGRGVSLTGGKAYTMGSGDVLSLVYQTDNSLWVETSRGKYL